MAYRRCIFVEFYRDIYRLNVLQVQSLNVTLQKTVIFTTLAPSITPKVAKACQIYTSESDEESHTR
jgi:hypothetical protein